MAREQLTTITRGTPAGLDVTAIDVAAQTTDGNSFVWGPNRAVYVLNGDDASITVTIPTPGTVGAGALAIADQDVTIAVGASKLIGPFGREFVQSTGLVHIDYAGTTITGVMAAVLDFAAV